MLYAQYFVLSIWGFVFCAIEKLHAIKKIENIVNFGTLNKMEYNVKYNQNMLRRKSMLRCKPLSRQNGSLVVEASIIVPVIILALAAVIYTAFVLYQYAYLQALADNYANQAALVWNHRKKDFETGGLELSEVEIPHLYWRLVDPDEHVKKNNVLEYLSLESSNKSMLAAKERIVSLDLKDCVVYKKLVVTVKESYEIPIGRLLKIFGANRHFSIEASSEAVIDDPAEFIRNTDFIVDIERELENTYPAVKNLSEKTRGIVKKIQSGLLNFFN